MELKIKNLLEMTPSPFNKSPNLDIRRYVVFPSDTNPTFDSGIDVNDLMRVLSEEELYQVVQDVTLAPHIKGSRYSPSVKHAGWSPIRITHNLRSLLTVLTDSGGLDIYSLSCSKWKHLISVSNQWHKICKSEWDKNPKKLNQSELLKLLKERTYKVKITAFAWGEVHHENVIWCPLFVGTMDGMILMWKISQQPTNITIDLISLVASDLGHITALNCPLVSHDGQAQYLLFCAALDGRIQTHVVGLTDKNESAAFVGQSYVTWSEQDKIEVPGGGLISSICQNRVILAVAKGPNLLLVMNSFQGSVVSNYVVNTNDLCITGVSFTSPDSLLISTTEGSVYNVAVRLDYNEFIQTDVTVVETSFQYENYRCNGFALSNSKAFICMLFSVQGNYDHLQLREYSQAVWCSFKDMDEAMNLISSHLGSLYDIWDILELLRIQCLKKNWSDKLLAVENTDELDVMDVCNLKKSLWFVEIAIKMDSNTNENRKSLESLRDEMTTLIMSSHVFKRVTQLIATGEEELTDVELDSLRVMRNWLYFLVNIGLKPTYAATHATASTLLQQIDDNFSDIDKDEMCTICGSHIEGVEDITTAVCVQGHTIPRCFLSMVQCGILPYYTCPVCKVIAHPSAVTSNSCTCVFCDSYLRLDDKINTDDDMEQETGILFG